ncbi:carotenoid biosynthesis protein [Williamsia sp. CHRR-6]|uniref:carotenoid biosynthesis protein n=1 Tax=Williamsia sp. CHRR-6 TaxID=2835871 RepID=UPI001BDADB25|nr:carotenoid biosynthesis protein [Williamsia sp. CHRR-6]MBT0565275.1 carotenoid biosynthesis protein [Williamsia sp. CHRR-6]
MVGLLAIGASIAAQIVYPLVSGSTRDAATVVVVCAAALAMACDAVARRGPAGAALIIVPVAAISYGAEVMGTRTGFPFGEYSYAQGRIGPSLFEVPVVITAAWFMGGYAVWRIAAFAISGTVSRIVIATVALVGWDLYLDPQMVEAGLWRWVQTDAGPPGIEQIPLTNFAGWALLGVVVFTVLTWTDPPDPAASRSAGPEGVVWHSFPLIPMIWFGWTWLGSALAQLVLLYDGRLATGVPYAVVAMAALGVPAAARAARCRRSDHPPGTMSGCVP